VVTASASSKAFAKSNPTPSREFMLLRYAEDARLYIPLERMDLVQTIA